MTEPDFLARLRILHSQISAAPWTVVVADDGEPGIAHSSHSDGSKDVIRFVGDHGPVNETVLRFVCGLRNIAQSVFEDDVGNHSDSLAESVAELWKEVAVPFPAPWTSWVEGRDGVAFDSFILTGEGAARGDDLYPRLAADATRHEYMAVLDFLAAAASRLDDLLAIASSGHPLAERSEGSEAKQGRR